MAELLMELELDLCEVPDTNGASRLPQSTYIVKGGVFTGQRLVGKVELQAGVSAFSPLDGPTGPLQLTLCTQDHHTISLALQSLWIIEPDVLRQIQDGQDVPRVAYRHQVAPFFRTESARYAWLNQVEAMGIGCLKPNLVGLGYQIYAIS